MGHPVLREKAQALDRTALRSPAIQKLIDDMIDTMIEYHGVGLAAPQVHESVRVFVAQLGPDDPEVEAEPIVIVSETFAVRIIANSYNVRSSFPNGLGTLYPIRPYPLRGIQLYTILGRAHWNSDRLDFDSPAGE